MRARTTRFGLISPGEMGSAVAASTNADIEMIWNSGGRGAETRRRANASGMTEVASLDELVASSSVIMSICPPSDAVTVANQVIGLGFTGTYLDANAIAPGTARELSDAVGESATFVDGGIIGPPPDKPGTTRLYLAGEEAEKIATAFTDGPLRAIPLSGPPGAASALKACYAANTKTVGALLLAVRALAVHEGVERELLQEWEMSQPQTLRTSESLASGVAPKAWRFAGEMHEIGNAFDAAGLPDGFLRAAAQLYERLSSYKGSEAAVPLEDLIETLFKTKP